MVVWCALATAVLVASTHAFTPINSFVRRTTQQGGLACPSAVEGLAFGSSGVDRRQTNHQFQHMQEGLWVRRRSGGTARLSPAATGVPEVAERPDAEALDHAGKEEGDGGSSPSSKKLTERGGLLLLATVPLVWGTYGPSVKLMYQMGESPPGLLFNFACYAVSVMTFAAVASFKRAKGQRPAAVSSGGEVEGESRMPPKEKTLVDRYAARAGAELGLWLFIGGTVQVWGLQLTSASRAGFLVQLTTVIVPVLEAFLGRRKLKPQVWFACALATVGVALVSLGGVIPPGADIVKYVAGSLSASWLAPSGAWEGIMKGNLRGDLLVACSALFYSLHVVRLGVHVSKVDTLSLAKAKAFSELSFAGLSLVVAGFLGGQGANFARFMAALASKPDLLLVFVAVVVWNGALTSAYAMWAQTRGQASVAPSEANLVYSLQPLWSVLFAVVLLKESFRPVEAAGAALLLLSLFLVTTQSDSGAPPAPGDGGERAPADGDYETNAKEA